MLPVAGVSVQVLVLLVLPGKITGCYWQVLVFSVPGVTGCYWRYLCRLALPVQALLVLLLLVLVLLVLQVLLEVSAV